MPAQLLIKGATPKAEPWSPPSLTPPVALGRITVALLTIHNLLIDVECFQAECYAIGQKIQRRSVKLEDPDLQQHPGWNRAHAEWVHWHIDEWWAGENARTAGVMLRSHCFAVEMYWQDLTEVEREQVLSTVKHSAPEDAVLLRQMEKVRRCAVWQGILMVWATDWEQVTF
jgi:hypothetical protein